MNSQLLENNHNEKLQINRSKDEKLDENDRITQSIDELFDSSGDKYDFEKDFILLESKQNNKTIDDEEKRSTLNEDYAPGFTTNENEINKNVNFSEGFNEDVVPSKPSSLDVDDIPKIDFVPEADDMNDSKKP